MDLTKLTLEVAKKLRFRAKPNQVIDPSKAIPHSVLHWMIAKMAIESSVFYMYLTQGRLAIKKRVYGSTSNWRELKDEISENLENNPNKLILQVSCGSRGKRRKQPLIGYLGLYRKQEFSLAEKEALKDVAAFLGDYMYEILQINFTDHYHRAIQRINEIVSNHRQPGTQIKYIQGVVQRAIRAQASYFCILVNEALVVEYFQKNTWNRPRFVEDHPNHEISDVFERICEKNTFFQWIDIKVEQTLGSILRRYVTAKDDDSEYLIAVIKRESTPIAVWIFEFSQSQLLFFDIYRDLILYASEQARQSTYYLFQRRAKKLIVDPIFHSRDTKQEPDLAFTLMPFSQPWSKRIWEKIIKPVAAREGLRAIRADDLFGQDIMEDVWRGILTSRVVIADITGRNPNVFYELGIAHTLGKKVILLTQTINDIPFDLNRYRHIIYEDNLDGYSKLREQLRASLREMIQS